MADSNMVSGTRDLNQQFQKREIAGRVFTCNAPENTLLIRALQGGQSKFKISQVTNCVIEWQEDDDLPETSLITLPLELPASNGFACVLDPITNQQIQGAPTYPVSTISVQQPEIFLKYSVWSIDPPAGDCPPEVSTTLAKDQNQPEFIYVMDRDCVNKTLTVVRGWGGTPVHAVPAGTCIRLEFTAAPECPEWDATPMVARSSKRNYVQTFVDGFSTTEKYNMLMHHNSSGKSELEDHKRRLMGGRVNGNATDGHLVRQLENALLHGRPSMGGDNGVHAGMGGIDSFDIPCHNIGGAITPDSLDGIMQSIDDAGGLVNPSNYLFIMSHSARAMINKWASPTQMNMQPSMNMKWGVRVTSYESEFGSINFTTHRRLPKNTMYLLDTSKIGWIPIMNWKMGPLARQSILCDKFQIAGMFTMALACRCHHAKIVICPWCEDPTCFGKCKTPATPPTPYCDPTVPVFPPADPVEEEGVMKKPTAEDAKAMITPEQKLAAAQAALKSKQ